MTFKPGETTGFGESVGGGGANRGQMHSKCIANALFSKYQLMNELVLLNSKPAGHPIGNPIGFPIGNPIGKPIGNPIGFPKDFL